MTNIAILGFGVVGGGVARLITDNYANVCALGGEKINIKYILDLRDFPDSPFADRIIHDYDIIANDPEIDTVIEVMGGSHPAYEFTVKALQAGKNVITSNKEVVANFGDEFLALARANGVCYRFEAAVGGGIPVISPVISCVRQNKITEIRGILNGTTNYILTKMFTLGESFENALADAQAKGYAERNPDADILGTDACRKIVILTALVTGKLVSPDTVHTEGITAIRGADVRAAERLGYSIKLVGRCIVCEDDAPYVVVAPFMIPKDEPLSTVFGVYNAVEVEGEPLGNVMFYGQGAGAGATASAVVGDLCQIMRAGTHAASPYFERIKAPRDFSGFVARHYIATEGSAEDVIRVFGDVRLLEGDGGEIFFITSPLAERELSDKLGELHRTVKADIRLLD
ncbi:MAG: homoserine dehydrogenase [Clostridia bacterium]|nr:homoserine dehydrogenase [Clostridia bacterium]